METKSAEHVIVGPTLTVSHVYMYFYLFINVGALVSQITTVYSEKPLDHISIICGDKKCAVAYKVASLSSPRLATPAGMLQSSQHKLNYFRANRNTADHSSGSAAMLLQLVGVPLLIMSII
ncbi:hypothetical protein B0H14DRAFT_2558278 [Mycena olivaceomarginata]|nr:hypothetical protein B0H14DRAFT_2558278 [Mycena olivaceomarginata]